jgi:hypothetical protein
MSHLSVALLQFLAGAINIPGTLDKRNGCRWFSGFCAVLCFGLGVRSLFLHFGV